MSAANGDARGMPLTTAEAENTRKRLEVLLPDAQARTRCCFILEGHRTAKKCPRRARFFAPEDRAAFCHEHAKQYAFIKLLAEDLPALQPEGEKS